MCARAPDRTPEAGWWRWVGGEGGWGGKWMNAGEERQKRDTHCCIMG